MKRHGLRVSPVWPCLVLEGTGIIFGFTVIGGGIVSGLVSPVLGVSTFSPVHRGEPS